MGGGDIASTRSGGVNGIIVDTVVCTIGCVGLGTSNIQFKIHSILQTTNLLGFCFT
jgi:hypothetical protein